MIGAAGSAITIRTWAWHFLLADHELRRNPHYAPPDPRKTLEPETRVFPVSRTRRPLQ